MICIRITTISAVILMLIFDIYTQHIILSGSWVHKHNALTLRTASSPLLSLLNGPNMPRMNFRSPNLSLNSICILYLHFPCSCNTKMFYPRQTVPWYCSPIWLLAQSQLISHSSLNPIPSFYRWASIKAVQIKIRLQNSAQLSLLQRGPNWPSQSPLTATEAKVANVKILTNVTSITLLK